MLGAGQAGLEDGDNLYVKLDELKLARERTTGPDVLDADLRAYRASGESMVYGSLIVILSGKVPLLAH